MVPTFWIPISYLPNCMVSYSRLQQFYYSHENTKSHSLISLSCSMGIENSVRMLYCTRTHTHTHSLFKIRYHTSVIVFSACTVWKYQLFIYSVICCFFYLWCFQLISNARCPLLEKLRHNFISLVSVRWLRERKRTRASERPYVVNVNDINEGERTVRFCSSSGRFDGIALDRRNFVRNVGRKYLKCLPFASVRTSSRSYTFILSLCLLTFTFCCGVSRRYCRNVNIRIHRKKMFMGSDNSFYNLE
jgi:hypothetical protein